MNRRFYAPDRSDKRIAYAAAFLEDMRYVAVQNKEQADFVLLGINPPQELLCTDIPCFAGNATKNGVYDYTKDECFAAANAYLTAEGAIQYAIQHSEGSLVNAEILITGYGRIGKALQRYLSPFSRYITICARSDSARVNAEANGAQAIPFDELTDCAEYDYIFNTVPHPVFGESVLKTVRKDIVLMELASLPGGIDRHIAAHLGLNFVHAGGLPAKCSPKAAGSIVATTVDKLYRSVIA